MISQESNTGVICKRCEAKIRVEHVERVAPEFTVSCPHCGFRDFYRIADIKTFEAR